MVVETKVQVGGVWKDVTAPEVKVGGAWKAVTTIEAKVGGAWKTVFAASADSPTFVASSQATLNSNTREPTWSLTDVAGSGSNRAIVFVCHTEGVREVCHNTCTYNSVSLTRIDVEGTLTNGKEMHIDGGTASALSFWLMLNGDIPSAGAYTLALLFGGDLQQTQQGHHAVLMQWDDVDQTNPVGHVQARIAALFAEGTSFSTTQTGNANDGLVTACGASDAAGTYVAGDFVDAGSNMNIVSDGNARNAPGGALRVAHDIIPDASEVYQWTVNYGSETTVDSLVTASINLQAPGGGDPGLPCSPGCSEINDQFADEDSPTDAWAGVKWHSNGDISHYEATSQGFGATSGQTWIGSSSLHGCANTEYDFRWTQTGDTVTVSNITVNTWTQASLGDMEVENGETGSSGTTGSTVTFELRRRSDNVVILTDTFELEAQTNTASK